MTHLFSDELNKLSKEGFGRYVDKEEMAKDHIFLNEIASVLLSKLISRTLMNLSSLLFVIRTVQKICTQ